MFVRVSVVRTERTLTINNFDAISMFLLYVVFSQVQFQTKRPLQDARKENRRYECAEQRVHACP